MLSLARRYRYQAVLAGIVLVGAGLRFADLGSESIWIDEALSADRARLGPSELIDELRANSVHPPLYFLVLKHWAAVFGFSEVGLRSLSAVAGVAGIAALYLLAKELYDANAGLIAGAILAVSPFHIYYSQEARSYSLLFLLAVLSMHAYILAFISRRTPIAAGYYIVVTLALLHLHFNALFVLIAQVVHFAAFRARKEHAEDVRRFAGASLLVLVASIPLAVLTLEQIATAQRVFPGVVPRPSLLTLGRNFLVFGGDQLTAQPYRRYPIGIAVLSALALTAFVPLRLPHTDRYQRVSGQWWRASLSLMWVGSTVILPFLISRAATSIFVGRSLIPALAPLIVLASIGIARIASPALCAALVLVIVALTIVPLRAQYEVRSKGQWRQAVAYVEENAGNGASVVFQGSYAYRPFAYYQRRPDLHIIVADPGETSPAVTARKLRSEREGWLVLRSPRSRQLLEILKLLQGDFTVERNVAFGGLRLVRLQRAGP